MSASRTPSQPNERAEFILGLLPRAPFLFWGWLVGGGQWSVVSGQWSVARVVPNPNPNSNRRIAIEELEIGQ